MIKPQFVEKSKIQIFFNKIFSPAYVIAQGTVGVKDNIKQKQSLGMMGIIGISNIINTVASDMFSRKKELTIRRSIGMTQKQICRMFFLDSFKICLKSFVIMISFGACLTYLVASNTIVYWF